MDIEKYLELNTVYDNDSKLAIKFLMQFAYNQALEDAAENVTAYPKKIPDVGWVAEINLNKILSLKKH